MAAGRPKDIKTPEELLSHFEAYKKWAKSNPIYKQEAIKAGKNSGEIVKVELERPLSISGFISYCFREGITSNVEHYLLNWENRYEEFSSISAHIKQEIRGEQIDGGMVGIYNASLTARLNGLVDKKEVTGEFNVKQITGMEIK